MPKKIHIRIEGTIPSNSFINKVLKAACIEMTDGDEIQFFQLPNQNYLLQSYEERMQAAFNSFNLICDALSQTKNLIDFSNEKFDALLVIKNLRAYNEKIYDEYFHCLKVNNSINRFQKIYQDYLNELQVLLCHHFNLSSVKLLEKADEYALLPHTRPILLTIIPQHNLSMESSEDELYLIQIEIPQPSLDERMAEEFLKANPSRPDQPLWYQMMAREEKILFDYHMKGVDTTLKVREKFLSVSSRLRTIPGLANFSIHRMMILDSKKNNVYRVADRYRSSMIASRDFLKLEINSQQKDDLQDHLMLNHLSHLIQIFLAQQIQSPDKSNQYVDDANCLKVAAITSLPILLQTLISPLIPSSNFLLGSPDRLLYDAKRRLVERVRRQGIVIHIANNRLHFFPQNVIEVNHSLNPVRYAARTGSVFESGNTSKELSALKKLANIDDANSLDEVSFFDVGNEAPQDRNKQIIYEAIKDLDELLAHVPYLMSQVFYENQRELHLAALEEVIITRLDGLSYGSCVSGKDRKSLQTMYVDAIEVYLFLYGSLPKYQDTSTKRELFIDIFAEIFLSFHHQINAGFNAPGANGIKTPDLYLPTDIQNKIKSKSQNPDIFTQSNQLASNNEPEKILTSMKPTEEQNQKVLKNFESFATPTRTEAATKASSSSLSSSFIFFGSHSNSFVESERALNLTTAEINKGIVSDLHIIMKSPYLDTQGVNLFGQPKLPGGVEEMRGILKIMDDQPPEKVIEALARIVKTRFEKNERHRSATITLLYEVILGVNVNSPYQERNHWIKKLQELKASILQKESPLAVCHSIYAGNR